MQLKTDTHSMGRILINIPSEFVLLSSNTKINDDTILYLPDTPPEEIQFQFDKCVATLKNTMHLEFDSRTLFIRSFNLPNGGKAVMGWEHPYAMSAATLTCWFVSNDGGTYAWKTYVSPEYFDKVEYILETISNSITRYDFSDQIPTSYGFCFDGGFLHLQRDAIKEKINNIFTSPRLWLLEVKTSSGYDKKDYFDRFGPDYVEEARGEGIHVFRYSYRDINSLTAQEICILDPGESIADKASYDFKLYIQEEIEPVAHPDIYINMYTDIDGSNSIKQLDEEALSLWDAIVSTLRVRRGAL